MKPAALAAACVAAVVAFVVGGVSVLGGSTAVGSPAPRQTATVTATVTVTATATVTQTVTAPPVTETVTVTAQPSPTPTETTPPPPAVLMGMSTDDWAARVAETGPVAAHRIFQSTWNVPSLIAKIEADHANGVTPYWSIKFNTTWAAAANGTDDQRFRDLGNALAALPYPTFGSFHHEPRGDGIDTPAELVPWAEANVRAMSIVGPLAGTRHMLGTTDNGFPWSSRWGGLTDSQLAIYYTPALLAAADFLGGDFYDGTTDTNPGEPAAVKMTNFEAWSERVGFDGGLTVGEWQAVEAADIYAAWDVLRVGPWAIACIFNSAANNRPDLPSSLGGSWVLRGDRLAAFRDVLDQADIPGR